ncbi:MAG: DNA translocase FtsK 4TM domain-containing protein [Pseudomonadales bacterium]|nr:DNA translocase FtsK 4TM domain-containing protein [Pseudomonadales bacterium]
MIGMATLAVFVLLALVSYSREDPAWTYQASSTEMHNLVGTAGAWVSDVILTLFGWVGYGIPIGLVMGGYRIFKTEINELTWQSSLVSASGWLLLMLGISVLATLHAEPGPENIGLAEGAGGMLGKWIVDVGMESLNWVGLTLFGCLALVFGAQLAYGFSWLRVTERIGRVVYLLCARCISSTIQLYEQFKQRRDRKQDKAVSAEMRKPRKSVLRAKPKKRSAPAVKVAESIIKRPKPVTSQKRLFDTGVSGEMPNLDLLDENTSNADLGYSEESLEAMSRLLELKLLDFGIEVEVVEVLPGPVVTRFEISPAPGIKVSRITALVKDLARSLAVISVRVVEVVPGKPVVGIEIPNENREVVRLKELLSSSSYQEATSPLTLALGKDIAGEAVLLDIAKTPHMLIAGTTGSGKSVGVNAMLLSILYKATPEQVRLILVDPKMLELAIYEGIPHLLTPVVTDMKEAAQALQWCVAEMDRRYRLMASFGVRNIAGFNKRIQEAEKAGTPIMDPLWPPDSEEEAPEIQELPLIVVVIDEFADMMMIVGKKVEQLIARIAQKARAAGIHLVLATQRPSVDVITGLIKANIPTRLSFQVSSKVDSRTILDQGGAEQLLGHGDMLYLPPGTSLPVRVHGAFVSDEEVHRLVDDWKSRAGPNYLDDVLSPDLSMTQDPLAMDGNGSAEETDALYDEAVEFVLQSRRASISAVQRKLRIGYNRAARIIESMENAGLVSEMMSNGSREVLVPSNE